MRIIFRLLWFIKPYIGEVALSILMGVATITAGIGLLGTSAYLIASAALHPSIAELQVAIVGVRFFGISRAAFRYGERLISHSVNLHLVSSLRVWFYQKLLQVKQDDLSVYRSGDLLDRILHDLETLENFYVRVLSPSIVFMIVTTGVSLFMGNYDPQLGIILACGLFVTGFVLPVVSVVLSRRTSQNTARYNSDLSATLIETLTGLEDLQAFGTSHAQLAKAIAANRKVNVAQLQTSLLGGINNGLVLIVMNLTLLALIWYSIPLIQTEFLTGISLAVIVLVAMASFEAAQVIPAAAQRLTECVASAGRLFQIADHSAADKTELLHIIDGESTDLRLEDVNFQRTGGSDFTLEHISFDLKKGKKIAIVGPSGGGKSSMVDLILKFNIQDNGGILLDGENVQILNNESVRSQFGVLAQDAYLFNCSLRENLHFAKPDASDSEISSILSRVGLEAWLTALPHGLNTWIGDRGMMVSGGELQRIMIARLMLQDRSFLILDEPMVNLDAFIRRDLNKMLLTEFPQAGVLWISHTYSSMELMDEILYLEDGKIIERGDHHSLIARNGKYAAVYRLQQGAQILQT